MKLIQGGRVIDPVTKTDKIADLVLDGGRIVKMGQFEDDGSYEEVIEAKGYVVAPGLVDVHVHFRDPGLTYKEDIQTGAKAAARGGFTTVVCMANTKPAVDQEETLRYVLEEGRKTGIHVLAAAAVTKGLKGEELTDMKALKAAGAAGFTDDGIPLLNENMVKHAMEEAARLDMPLSFHEEDPAFIVNNGIHHGVVSEKLGLFWFSGTGRGCPGGKGLHDRTAYRASVNIQHISSRNAVKMVGLAKELGADVTAEVTPHHFTLTEEAVLEYGTRRKINRREPKKTVRH